MNKKDNQQNDDRIMVERAQQGDEEAFGVLVRRYQDRLYGLTSRYFPNAEDAAEAAQQVWVKAWQKLAKFKGRSGFYTWLYRLAVFHCLDLLRQRKRRSEVELLDAVELDRDLNQELAPSVNSRPDREAGQAEIRERFNAALEGLSPEHRMALVLREVEGLSYDEIARTMQSRKGTVMSRIFYARKYMQEELQDLRS